MNTSPIVETAEATEAPDGMAVPRHPAPVIASATVK
jgi:hypothetical protein